MPKKALLPLLILCLPLFLRAEDKTEANGEKVQTTEDRFQAAAKIARDRYVQLQTLNLRVPGATPTHASAVRVGCKLLLTNFHVLHADSMTAEPGSENKMVEVTIRALNPPTDMLAIESVVAMGDLPPIKFSEGAEVGELLINYSNANGQDGFLKSYRIAKVDDGGNHILLDRPALPGESGSGLFNLKGELVGIIDSTLQNGTDRLYGMAINAKVVKTFMEFVFKGSPELNTCVKK